ncbi:chitooligosaccharide deacetylase [alpha proteobacterium Q-1]|nr:chitooligosaccharide deacetylase [alpha proteobacterium Q-1]
MDLNREQVSYGSADQPAALADVMSVDVEDYFQVSAMEGIIDRRDWPSMACRVERNVHEILDLFDRHQAKATFFTLGWIARRYPDLIREIAKRGHEIASHGMQHIRVSSQSPEAFRSDVRESRALLEDISGSVVLGYRAASFSLTPGTDWAHAILAEEGYRYSSSIYPIKHDHYGIPDAPRSAYQPLADRDFLEIPISTMMLGGRRLPCGGGGYFRLLPFAASNWMMERVRAHDAMPLIFYFHPWEIDPDQPRIEGLGAKTRFRHYTNLSRMKMKLERLLQKGRWDRFDSRFAVGKAL